jgi:hypothetical protein
MINRKENFVKSYVIGTTALPSDVRKGYALPEVSLKCLGLRPL